MFRLPFQSRIEVRHFGKTTILRKHANTCLAEFCQGLKIDSVINIGSKPDAPDKEGRKYEDYFPGAEFRSLDLGPHNHPRHIHADLMDNSLSIGQFDLAIAIAVIEHIDRPWIAAKQITNLVREGGYLFICMPWLYPVHEGPFFGDHWRSTPSAMKFLFPDLDEVRHEYAPTSILKVRDRRNYWNDPNACAAGFSMLMRRTRIQAA